MQLSKVTEKSKHEEEGPSAQNQRITVTLPPMETHIWKNVVLTTPPKYLVLINVSTKVYNHIINIYTFFTS